MAQDPLTPPCQTGAALEPVQWPHGFPLGLLTEEGGAAAAAHDLHCTLRHSALVLDVWQTGIPADLPAVFAVVERQGGARGWLYGDVLWRLRGLMDAVLGGVGLRRVRRATGPLQVGECVDFWRVELLERDRLLRLRAEFKVPGRAWLEFQFGSQPSGGTMLRTVAAFEPAGLAGWLYYALFYLPHRIVLGGLQRAIASAAQSENH